MDAARVHVRCLEGALLFLLDKFGKFYIFFITSFRFILSLVKIESFWSKIG